MASFRLGLTQSEFEERKKRAIAAGLSEGQIEADVRGEESRLKRERQSTQQLQKKEAGKENLFTKATRLLGGPTTATTLDIAQPGKGKAEESIALKEEMLQESRSLISQAINETDPKKKEELLSRSRKLDATAPELTKQQSRVLNAGDAERNIAIAGETAPALLSLIPGVGPMVGGALSGGIQASTALTDEELGSKEDLALRAKRGAGGVAIGAATGYVLNKAFKALSNIGNKSTNIADDIKQGVVNPVVKDGTKSIAERKALNQAVDELNIRKPTASGMLQAGQNKSAALNNKLGGVVEGSSDTYARKKLVDQIEKNVGQEIVLSTETKGTRRIFENILENKVPQGSKLTAKQLLKANQSLEVGRIFKKLADPLSAPLTKAETITFQTWRAVNSALKETAPKAAGEILEQLSTLHKLNAGFEYAARRKIGLPGMGSTGLGVSATPLQGAQSGIAGIFNKAGKGAQTAGAVNQRLGDILTPPGLTNQFTQQASQTGLSNILAGKFAQPQQPMEGPTTQEQPQQQGQQPTAQQPQPAPEPGEIPQITSEQMQQVIASDMSTKRKKKYQDIFDLQQEQVKTEAVDSSTRVIETQLDNIERILDDPGLSTGLVGGRFEQIQSALKLDPRLDELKQVLTISAPVIGKNILELGRLTDEDVQLALKTLPDVTKTPAENKKRLKNLRELLKQMKGTVRSETSLQDAIDEAMDQ